MTQSKRMKDSSESYWIQRYWYYGQKQMCNSLVCFRYFFSLLCLIGLIESSSPHWMESYTIIHLDHTHIKAYSVFALSGPSITRHGPLLVTILVNLITIVKELMFLLRGTTVCWMNLLLVGISSLWFESNCDHVCARIYIQFLLYSI